MSERIIGYDLARALAVFGMVIVNFNVVMSEPAAGPAWLATALRLLEGRAAATFVVLAGIGIALLSRQARDSSDPTAMASTRSTLLRRALFLFVVGLLYTPIWTADILHFYGVYIAAAAFLFASPPRRLWAIAWSLVLGFVGLMAMLDYDRGWNWETLEYTGFWSLQGMVRHVLFNGFHPVVPWLAFLLLGLIVGRLDMTDPATRRRVLVAGAGAAVATEILSRVLVRLTGAGRAPNVVPELEFLLGTAPMPPMPLYMIAGAGTACAVIALTVGIGIRFGHVAWIRPLVHTGQLALTLYVAHVVLGMGTIESLGGLQDRSLTFVVGSSVLFCGLGVVFSHVWRRRFRRGPLEAIMRSLT